MARLAVTTQDVSTILTETERGGSRRHRRGRTGTSGEADAVRRLGEGRLSTPEQYGNIVVRTGPTAPSSTSKTSPASNSPPRLLTFQQAQRRATAIIGVYQLPDANALEVAKGVRKVMDSLAPTFPKGIHYVIPYDTTLFVSESVPEVGQGRCSRAGWC